MSTRIKICGIKDIEIATVAVEAGADYIGLVFVEKSPRYVTPEDAKAIVSAIKQSGKDVQFVGLFVDHDVADMLRIAADVGLDVLQLHGAEKPKILDALADYEVLKALSFKQISDDEGEIEHIQPWIDAANHYEQLTALLIDAPPAKGLTGGTGVAVDWPLLKTTLFELELDQMNSRILMPPVMLAGGLGPKNVGKAIDITRPFGVDVSSGVESERGVKSADLIRKFCAAAKD